ncbi:MAG: L-seryl-tRNA(Sec) selenium transferase [Gemmatimonadales bacterium]
MSDHRRGLPSVDRLLHLPGVAALLESAPRNLVVAAARQVLERARRDPASVPDDWTAEVAEAVAVRNAPSLYPMVNATGVVLHTNLGRAPLPRAAIEAALRIGGGYSNLELDVSTGARGSRMDHCAALLAERAGAEEAMVVNNAAGALILALNGLAAGRDVLISRGELVEIGGSFRIPDIMGKSGARLREVGTTNRTHLADYRAAASDHTGAILVVHRSNFRMTGFVASPPLGELAALARDLGVPLIFDAGSGLLVDLGRYGLVDEPLVPESAAVADLVVFSGDKLLGGPQAGCLAGRRSVLAQLRRNPFARALRTDKMTLAALEATLALYRDPDAAVRVIPVLAMLTADAAALADRAEALARCLSPHWPATLAPGQSAVGGGSFPEAPLPTTLVRVDPGPIGAQALALKLRVGTPPVLVRVEDGHVILDPRTIAPSELDLVGRAFAGALQ